MHNSVIDSSLGKNKISIKIGNPLVIFLNGADSFDTEQTFRPIIEQLPNSLGILAIDYLNVGLSGLAQKDYTLEEQSEEFINFIKSLHPKRIIIVAHSIGGIYAIRLANKLSNVTDFIGIEPTTKEIVTNPPKKSSYINAMQKYADKTAKEMEMIVKNWIDDNFSKSLANLIWQTSLNNGKRSINHIAIDIEKSINKNDKYKLRKSIKSIIFTEPFRSAEYSRSEYKTDDTDLYKFGNFHYLHWKYPDKIAEKIIELI